MRRFTQIALVAILTLVVAGPVPAARATDGSPLWVARYNGPPGGRNDQTTAVALSPDGARVYVTGYSKGSGSYNYATVAYDAATGAEVWVRRYDGPAHGEDIANALAVSPDGGRLYVTGQSYGSGTETDYATVGYDASTGAKVWVRRYNGPANDFDAANAIAVSHDGARLYVTGQSYGPGTETDYATVSYDAADGAKVWVRRYDGPGGSFDDALYLAVSPDGARVYVTGYSRGSGTSEDYATVAYDAADGARVWVRRYNGPGGTLDDALDLAVSPDGARVFVTGYSYGPGTFADYATVAYDAATGAKDWVRRYNGPGESEDQANALVVSPDGARVYVTGYSYGPGAKTDYATVAYDADTGAEVWVRRYNGPGSGYDDARDLTVSPDGASVYVTGDSFGSGTYYDYATVAYSTA